MSLNEDFRVLKLQLISNVHKCWLAMPLGAGVLCCCWLLACRTIEEENDRLALTSLGNPTLLIALKSWHSDGFIDTHEGKVIWWHYHNDTMSSWYNDISLPYKMLQQENHHVCLIWWREIGNILLIKSDILVMQSYIPVLDFYLVCVLSISSSKYKIKIQKSRIEGGGVSRLSSRKKLSLTVETSSNLGPNI